ncbi:phosphopyruvate hydratase [Candidatus Woesebacteria bacterium]|nr:phosphopyruvate hydratase [Candidatus Woesebacteria bacterium]
MDSEIKSVEAREILSASDSPTIEVEITLEDGTNEKASVPFGTSSGSYEAVTMIDNDPKRYGGQGMLKAVENIENIISPEVIGMDSLNQKLLDEKLLSLDPTARKEDLGGNSLLSVSLAVARSASKYKNIPLYQHLREVYKMESNLGSMPKPMMVLMEGGVHADNATDFQEYLLAVTYDANTADCVRVGAEIYKTLGKILDENGFDINVGLEGAYAAVNMKSNTDPIEYIRRAIEQSGYNFGSDANIALDIASSEFFKDQKYNFSTENLELNSDELLKYYIELVEKYHVFSIEDPFFEDDWEAWRIMFENLGDKIKIVGDDLTVTQVSRLQKAIDSKAINSIIIKPNQVGTLTETMETIMLAKSHGIDLIVSHRGGGETTDTFIIDLAVSVGAKYVKVGPSRGERTIKYNRLMEIGKELAL